MKVENLKDLRKLIRLCRELGIDAFEIGEIKFNLGYEPQKPSQAVKLKETAPTQTTFAPGGITDETTIKSEWDSLTDEQKMMWSAQDRVEN